MFEAATDNGTTMWPCKRGDNKDLISAWKEDKKSRTGKAGVFLQNRQDLMNVDLQANDYILGIYTVSRFVLIQRFNLVLSVKTKVCLLRATFLTSWNGARIPVHQRQGSRI